MGILRTGIDMVEINRLELLNPEIRRRFIDRVFTPVEVENCHGSLPSLAGVFAAKEAVSKALGCGIGPISWKEIEIIHGEQGQPILNLHDNANRIADQSGLVNWSISISHTREHAVAIAVATN